MASTFKIKKEVKNLEELSEIFKKNLDQKFQITIEKADKGVKKFITGNTADVLNIKKNAYHGVALTLSDRVEGADYQVISWGVYVPNVLLNQVVGHTGILDRLICNLIFGKGKDLYDKFQETIINELDGKEVNTGLLSSAKAAMKGKSVFDED